MELRDVFAVRGTTYAEGQTLYDLANPGEDEGVDVPQAPAFGVYGLVSRPSAANDNGLCEAITADVGGTNVVVATRDTRAESVVGKLAEGDVALWSVGNNCVLLKANGTVSIRHNAAAGGADAWIQIESDGAIKIGNAGGGIEITTAGKVTIYGSGGEAMAIGGGSVALTAPEVKLQSATTMLHAAAARPLSFIPTSGVAGPALNVFV